MIWACAISPCHPEGIELARHWLGILFPKST